MGDPTKVDQAGLTYVVKDIEIGATTPGGSGTSLSSTELTFLDGAAAANTGTNKAVITGTSGAVTIPGVLDASTAGLRTIQAVNDVHNTTPTKAELTTSFGDPATIGRGFVGTVDDNNGDAISYIVWASDANYYFVIGTKAT